MRHFALLLLFTSLAASLSVQAQPTQHHRHRRHISTDRLKVAKPQPVVPVQPVRPLTPAEMPPQPAEVMYVQGKLTVSANNSSLDQILHQIGRLTGTQISGSAGDERVFGKYGPASASEVLTTLLNGASSNMLLISGNGPAPSELILTPQTGKGSTVASNPIPPPMRPENNAEENSEAEPENPAPMPTFPPQPLQNNEPGQKTGPDNAGAGTTNPSSPNGIKTPQEIYQELQKLRRQRVPQTPPTD
ncbi:MAG: hypothetical protein ACYC46_06705 [Acidobacteriaceae bacterium]